MGLHLGAGRRVLGVLRGGWAGGAAGEGKGRGGAGDLAELPVDWLGVSQMTPEGAWKGSLSLQAGSKGKASCSLRGREALRHSVLSHSWSLKTFTWGALVVRGEGGARHTHPRNCQYPQTLADVPGTRGQAPPEPRPLRRARTSHTLTHVSAHRAMLTSHYLCYCNYIIRCFMQNYSPRTN